MTARSASQLASHRCPLFPFSIFSPIRSGSAYLPVTAGIVVAAGISRLFARIGTRPASQPPH